MALSWFDRKKADSGEWTGFLEQGVKLEGKLETTGTFRLDGTMKGALISDETMILGEHASAEGEITANCVLIAGRFDGTIRAGAKVELQENAAVTGEIYTPSLVIETGAVFDGNCHMPSTAQGATAVIIQIRHAPARA